MEEQRWVKSNAAGLTGELQGATSLAEFGQRLHLGPRARCLAVVSRRSTRSRPTRSGCGGSPATGWRKSAEAADSFQPGRGTGRPVRARAQTGRTRRPAPGLLPDRLRAGPGRAGPGRRRGRCFPGTRSWGWSSSPPSGRCGPSEQALLDELLPVAAMSLEILQRNLRTQELLGQTQEQARQLEEQTEELTQSRRSCLRSRRS